MNQVKINEEACKGCGLCVRACPKEILQMADRLNAKGLSPAECTDMDSCTACRSCALTCPDVCIAVYKEEK